MSEADEADLDLLDRCLSGEGSAEGLEALARRIASDGTLSRALMALRAASRQKDAPQRWDVQAAWQRLQREIQSAPTRSVYLFPDAWSSRTRAESRNWRRSLPRVVAAAAVLVIVTGVIAGVLRHERTAGPAAEAEARPREIATTRQERATIDLADGSHVILGPESRLIIPARFYSPAGVGARDVELEGQAVFIVAHDAARPFRVRAMGVVISDIGTEFDVSAYRNDSTLSIAVSHGSVEVAHALYTDTATTNTGSVVLGKGDIGAIGKDGRLAVTRNARVTGYFSWVGGDLVFERTPLPQVVRAIGRWYDLDVRVTDSRLARRLVNAQFSTQSPSAMLDALASAVGARVERKGRVITLVLER